MPAITLRHHRPRLHIALPHGFLNDPNGPVWLGDTAHLYFQSRPCPDIAVPVQWGHATSPDLVNWTLHRPAMSPVPGGPDSGGCWSGNTVAEAGRIRAYYSGKNESDAHQPVLTAVSDERGGAFGAPTLVVGAPDPGEQVAMFRDPFVWEEDGVWLMAVGAALEGGIAAIRGYRSEDGLDWEYTGDLARLRREVIGREDTGEGWECPQVLRIDGRRFALVSAWSRAAGGGKVLAFDLDERPVRPSPVDDGSDFYAASVMQQNGHAHAVFGWITEGREAEWWRQDGWAGAISLPREAWIADGLLRSKPYRAVDTLRRGASRPANRSAASAQAEIVVPDPGGNVTLHFGPDERCEIALDPLDGSVRIDRAHASRDPRADTSPILVRDAFDHSTGLPALRVILDGSILEAFTSAGRSFTTRLYPEAEPPWEVHAPDKAVLWDLAPSTDTRMDGHPAQANALLSGTTG